jgi:hypothetical protein
MFSLLTAILFGATGLVGAEHPAATSRTAARELAHWLIRAGFGAGLPLASPQSKLLEEDGYDLGPEVWAELEASYVFLPALVAWFRRRSMGGPA